MELVELAPSVPVTDPNEERVVSGVREKAA
jgi:hypothetical protein